MAESDPLTGVDPEQPARDYFLNEALVQVLTIFSDGTTELADHAGAGQECLFENVTKRPSLAGKLAAIHERSVSETTRRQRDINKITLSQPGINLSALVPPAQLEEVSHGVSDSLDSGEKAAVAQFYLAERPDDETQDANLQSVFTEFLGDKPRPKDLKWLVCNHHDDNINQEFYVDPQAWQAGVDEEGGYFFTKWSRHVQQSKGQWKAEQRIRAGRPYDMDIAGDPGLKGIPHTRYAREPAVSRGYYFISDRKGFIHHALKEAITFIARIQDNVFKAVLLFDPPQNQSRTRSKPRLKEDGSLPTITKTFIDDKRSRDRFRAYLVGRLSTINSTELRADVFEGIVEGILIGIVLQDELSVLAELSVSLDQVELSLGDDKNVVERLSGWRTFFGEWRNRLFHLGSMLDLIRQALTAKDGRHKEKPLLCAKLAAVNKALASMNKRMDGTYQAVMMTISIIESERAVREAQAVTTLTHLAFFFIPLSLVAAVLAMPLDEFKNSTNMKIWLWITLSICLMAIVYSILYRKLLLQLSRDATASIKNWTKGSSGEMLTNFCSICFWFTLGFLSIALVLAFFAGCGVGIWKIVTDGGLSEAAKGGLSFLLVFIALSVCGCVCSAVED